MKSFGDKSEINNGYLPGMGILPVGDSFRHKLVTQVFF